MKRLIAVLLALILCAGLAACASGSADQKDPAVTGAPSDTTPSGGAYVPGDYTKQFAMKIAEAASKPMRLSMKTKMDMGKGAENVEAVVYFSNEEKMAVDVTYSDGSIRVLRNGSDAYLIMDDYALKTAIEKTANPMNGITEVTKDTDKAKFLSGTEEIDGKTYAWEQIEGSEGKMYFEQGTGALKYVGSNDSLMELVSYDNDVDASVFELPEGITIMDMGDLSDYAAAA